MKQTTYLSRNKLYFLVFYLAFLGGFLPSKLLAQSQMLLKQGATDILHSTGSYNFNSVQIGANSGDVNFGIHNVGNAELSVLGMQINGANASMFSSVFATSTIGIGGNSNFTLRFTPTLACMTATAFVTVNVSSPNAIPSSFENITTANGLNNNNVNDVWVNGSVMYVATDDGLAISTNNGLSFSNRTTTNGLGSNRVNSVFISASRIFVGTDNGFSFSTDGGNNFTNRGTAQGIASKFVKDVWVDLATSKVFAASPSDIGTGGGISFSTDGGNSFTRKTTHGTASADEVYGIHAINNTVFAAHGANPGLAFSTDGGLTYSSSGMTGLGSSPISKVYAVGSKVYAATVSGLSISSDGGVNFTNKTTANGLGEDFIRSVWANGNRVYAGTDTNGLSFSSDGGNTFISVTTQNGLAGNTVWNIAEYNNVVYVCTNNGLSIVKNDGVYHFTVTGTGFQTAQIPVINQGAFISSCGTSVTLNTNTVLPNYQWHYSSDNVNFSSVGTNSNSLTATLSGYYRLNNFASCGNAFSSVTQVNFVSAVTPILNQGAFISSCGTSVTLNTNTVLPNYQWHYSSDNVNFSSVGTNSNSLTATLSGYYRLNNFTSCGNAFSSVTQIAFSSANLPIISQGNFVSACQNSPPTLSANMAGQWQVSSDNINFSNYGAANQSMITANTAGTYRLNVFASCGNIFSSVTQVSFNNGSIPSIHQGSFISVCGSNNRVLTTNDAAHWLYSSDNLNFTSVAFNTASYTATQAGFYKIMLNNACGQNFSTVSRLAFTSVVPIGLNHGTLLFLTGGQANLSANFVINWNDYSQVDWEYQATPNANFAVISSWNTTHTATQAGFYRFKAVNNCGIVFSSVVEIRDSNFNDPPTFTVSEQWLSVPNNLGEIIRLDFISSINDGDADLNQKVSLFVTVSNPSLFVKQPHITPNGKLIFTPVQGAEGWFYLDIYAKDDGSGNFPNINTSQVKRIYGYLMSKNLAFIDINNNGVFDASDFPASNRQIKIKQNSWWGTYDWYSYTDHQGYYYLYGWQQPNGGFGSFVSQPNANDFPAGTNFIPNQYAENFVKNGYVGGKDFAIQIPNKIDLSVHIWDWWWMRARPGFLTYYTLSYRNDGIEPKSGKVSFNFDPILEYRGNYSYSYFTNNSSNSNTFISANTLTIDYQDLKPGESRMVWAWFRVPPDVNLLGKAVNCNATITPNDNNPSNNVSVSSRIITGAYDPNDKHVTPEGNIPPKFIADGKYLEYRVRFQNTGTDTAFNIRVEDQLSTNLDLSTLQMIGSSHAYRLKIDSVGKAIWYFDDILLPDNKTNDAGSNGYFIYRIKPKNTLVLNDEIKSKAYIYFDYNPPIITNETLTKVWADLLAPTVSLYKSEINAQNVAANNDLYLTFDESVQKIANKKIFIKENGILKQSLDMSDSRIMVEGKNVAIDVADFGLEKNITVEIEEGAFQDLAANPFAGTNTWTFKTQKLNQAPSFSKGENIAVLENESYFNAWASQISAGQNEAHQRVKFVLEVQNSEIFSEQPEIWANGMLAFRAKKAGTSLVKVKLQDDGGTAQGGIDTSNELSFVINIVAAPTPNPPNPTVSSSPSPILTTNFGGQAVTLNTNVVTEIQTPFEVGKPIPIGLIIKDLKGNALYGVSSQNAFIQFTKIGQQEITLIDQHGISFKIKVNVVKQKQSLVASQLKNLPNVIWNSAIFTPDFGLNADFEIIQGLATKTSNNQIQIGKFVGEIKLKVWLPETDFAEKSNSVEIEFNALKANQTLTFEPIQNPTFGDADFELKAISNPNLALSYEILEGNDKIQIIGNSVKILKAGFVKVRAVQKGDEFYNNAVSEERSFEILKKAQQISFANISDITLTSNESPIVLNANSTSGLPIRFEVLPKEAATLNGNILTVKQLGTIVVVAYQDGNENYLSAQWQNRSFKVFGTLSITNVAVETDLEHLTIQFRTTGNFGASNQFGLLLSDSEGKFTNENYVKFVGNLERTIQIAVPENIIKSGSYKVKVVSLSPKITSLEVNVPKTLAPKPLTPFIRQNGLELCASETAEKYQWFLNGVAIQGATNQCFTLTNTSGRTESENYYNVILYNGERASHASTKFVPVLSKIITGIEEIERSKDLTVYPNPSSGVFQVRLAQSFESAEVKIFDINGKLIFLKSLKNIQKIDEQIDLQEKVIGLYYLRIETEKGIFVKKLNLN